MDEYGSYYKVQPQKLIVIDVYRIRKMMRRNQLKTILHELVHALRNSTREDIVERDTEALAITIGLIKPRRA
jgi:Zn-dependent peptidase ImmA (M78 family)